MRNIMIKIEYDGTNYSGWQMQSNAITIQEEIVKAIKKLTNENTLVNGSGRTDAKVHAREQVANFHIKSTIPAKQITRGLNHFLPPDIAIIGTEDVEEEFHARYWAKGKIYSYHIYNHLQRSALLRNYSYHIPGQLDLKNMGKAAGLLIGTHDFKGFMNSGSKVKDTIRTIHDIKIRKVENDLVLTFEGNGFLYNMVRIMVGTLVEISMGRREIDSLEEILTMGDRNKAGHTAPPQGLFLDRVIY